jgi:hypothetical protein
MTCGIVSDEFALTVRSSKAVASVTDVAEDAADDDRGRSHPYSIIHYRFKASDNIVYTGSLKREGWDKERYLSEKIEVRYDATDPRVNGEVPVRPPIFLLLLTSTVSLVILTYLGKYLYIENLSGLEPSKVQEK